MKLTQINRHCVTCAQFKAPHDGCVCLDCIDHWKSGNLLQVPLCYEKIKSADSAWRETNGLQPRS